MAAIPNYLALTLAHHVAAIYHNRSRERERENADRYITIQTSDNNIQEPLNFIPMGFEFTFFPPKGQTITGWSSIDSDEVIDKLAELIGTKKCQNIYVDGPVFEICSPVFKSHKEVEDFYDLMIKATRKLKLRPIASEQASGGLHINCAIPSNKTVKSIRSSTFHQKFMQNLAIDIANRPYLNWVFNDPSDDENANCLWSIGGEHRRFLKREISKRAVYQIGDKDSAINAKDNDHFEFRIFDMCNSKADLMNKIDFVNAYMRFIFNKTKLGIKITRSKLITDNMIKNECYSIRPHIAEREYKLFIKQLGLSPKRFNPYLKNMHRRYDLCWELSQNFLK